MVCFMKALRVLAVLSFASLVWAQGPPTSGSETVARPRTKQATPPPTPPPSRASQDPLRFNKKDVPQGVPVFSTDALTISVDVAVLDNKDHFIPKLPKGYFRILEDNAPAADQHLFGSAKRP